MMISRASSTWLSLRRLEERLPIGVQRKVLPRVLPRYDPYTSFNDAHQAIFIHVPKTAGTSLTDALGIEHARHVSISRYAAFDRERCDRYFKFCFVRNPWDRLHSAFTYLHGQIGTDESDDATWAGANLASYRTFEDFVVALEQARTRSRLLSYVHFRPQLRWIRLPGATLPLMDFIGRFETLNEDFEFLSDRLRLDRPLPRRRVQSNTPYREVYSQKMREIVAAIYRKDIGVLGYTF